MCGRQSLLVSYYLLGSFHYLTLFLILSLCACVILGRLMYVTWKKVVFA